MSEQTKQCPFCAETIQAAAIVCRYCGRDLPEKPAPATPVEVWTCPTCGREQYRDRAKGCAFCTRQGVPADDRALIQQEIAHYTGQGWQIVSQTDTSAQIRKPRQWSAAGLVFLVIAPGIVGCFWWPAFGIALIGLLLVAAAYLSGKDELLFLEATQIRRRAENDRIGKEHPFVARADDGGAICSACRKSIRRDATTCKHCGVAFEQRPEGFLAP